MKKWEDTLLCLIVLISLVIAGCMFFPKFMDKPEYLQEKYIVRENDTLWGLATKYSSNDDYITKWVYTVKKLNGMTESGLYERDEIIILKEVIE